MVSSRHPPPSWSGGPKLVEQFVVVCRENFLRGPLIWLWFCWKWWITCPLLSQVRNSAWVRLPVSYCLCWLYLLYVHHSLETTPGVVCTGTYVCFVVYTCISINS